MFGPVASLYCRTRVVNGAAGVEDFGATSMEFAGGFHGQLTSIWHSMIARASNRRLEVFAENLFAASDADTLGPIVFQRGHGRQRGDYRRRRSDGPIHRKDFARAAVPGADQGSAGGSLRREDATFIAALKGACEPDPGICDRGDGAADGRSGIRFGALGRRGSQ